MAISTLNAQPAFVAGEGSGGTEVTSGGYKYHTFTSSGTFTVNAPGTFEVLVVAGGGAGGYRLAGLVSNFGGGGAGGAINDTVYLPTGNHTVVVGAGGAVDNTPNGDHSSLGTYLTAFGGGKGAGYQTGTPTAPDVAISLSGYNGGSGGGGRSTTSADRTYIGYGVANQGNDGGYGHSGTTSSDGGGGGGGAGADGAAGTATIGGDGGDGINLSAWATATSTGDSGYYAGGGGGARYAANAGSGGLGGGGKGDDRGSGSASTSGSANTGGGGGGSYSTLTPGTGGSGIVIIRYAV
jgi:hypothetical protein